MAGLVLAVMGLIIVGLVVMIVYRWPSDTPDADVMVKASLEHQIEEAHGWPPATFESDVTKREESNARWAERNPSAFVPVPPPEHDQDAERWALTAWKTPSIEEPSVAVPATRPYVPDDGPIIGYVAGPRKGMRFAIRVHEWDIPAPVGDVAPPPLNREIFNPAGMGLNENWTPNVPAVPITSRKRQLPTKIGSSVRVHMDAIQRVSKAILDAGMPSEFHIDQETANQLLNEYREMRVRAGLPPLDENEPLVLANAQLVVDAE